MAGVRNGALAFLVTNDQGWHPLFVVAVNHTVLLKTVHVFNGSGAAGDAVVRIADPLSPATAYLPRFELEADGIQVWEGWTALNPGQQLQCSATTGGFHFWAAGADLPGAIVPLPPGDLVQLGLS